MPEEEVVELKFRLYDGSDIGPFRYTPASTVAMLKDQIFADWPKGLRLRVLEFSWSPCPGSFAAKLQTNAATIAVIEDLKTTDKKIIPKAANDIKLISAGKILENNKTVGQCRVPFSELPKGVITVHVVVQPYLLKAKTEKKVDEVPRKHICACSIL